MGKLRFGIYLPFHMLPKDLPTTGRFSLLKDLVLEAERLGYHSVWLDDHLMYNDYPILETWTTLTALSQATSRIRLGTMVTCMAHRNPALMAKTAATLDIVSGGRLELGVGAGVQEREHVAYGFGFPAYGVRVERLAESLEVMKRLWTQNSASYRGKHYVLSEAVCEPKPMQKPHPPITVGGTSKALLLKATAPYADRFDWGLMPSPEAYKRKLAVLEKQCRAVGRRFGEIEKSCWPAGQVLIAKNKEELDEKISQHKPAGIRLEEFCKTTLAATPEGCMKLLQVYADLGVTFFMLYFADFPRLDGLQLFAKEVAAKMGG